MDGWMDSQCFMSSHHSSVLRVVFLLVYYFLLACCVGWLGIYVRTVKLHWVERVVSVDP